MLVRNRARNERGVAYPSPLVMLSVLAVAMAGIAFVVTKDQPETERQITPAASSPSTSSQSTPTETPTATPEKKPKPTIQRGKVFVEVYNNTSISGLAGDVAERATDVGWQVVGSDNWVGTIPANTVYFPARLKAAGRQLALDLGIRRVQPAVGAMKLDRLTVVLTAPLGYVRAGATSGLLASVELTSPEARERYDALAANLARTVIGLDFDGVLSPIVDDPAEAHIHPDAHDVLLPLASKALAVAVITGRPARQALALGGLDDIGAEIAAGGQRALPLRPVRQRALVVDATGGSSPRDRRRGCPASCASCRSCCGRPDAADAHVEEKGLAVAVHTRQLDDPAGAQERLISVLEKAAAQHDLALEPGRAVVEVRAGGMHKGLVVDYLVEDLEAGGFLFAGDDLGDLEAFHAVADLRERGLDTLLVCSASDEQSALVELADVVVPGPDGVLEPAPPTSPPTPPDAASD